MLGKEAWLAGCRTIGCWSFPTPFVVALTHTLYYSPLICSPFTTTGLYVNLATWGGVGQDMLGFDSQRTGSTLYAHLRYTKVNPGVCAVWCAGWMGWGFAGVLPSFPRLCCVPINPHT